MGQHSNRLRNTKHTEKQIVRTYVRNASLGACEKG